MGSACSSDGSVQHSNSVTHQHCSSRSIAVAARLPPLAPVFPPPGGLPPSFTHKESMMVLVSARRMVPAIDCTRLLLTSDQHDSKSHSRLSGGPSARRAEEGEAVSTEGRNTAAKQSSTGSCIEGESLRPLQPTPPGPGTWKPERGSCGPLPGSDSCHSIDTPPSPLPRRLDQVRVGTPMTRTQSATASPSVSQRPQPLCLSDPLGWGLVALAFDLHNSDNSPRDSPCGTPTSMARRRIGSAIPKTIDERRKERRSKGKSQPLWLTPKFALQCDASTTSSESQPQPPPIAEPKLSEAQKRHLHANSHLWTAPHIFLKYPDAMFAYYSTLPLSSPASQVRSTGTPGSTSRSSMSGTSDTSLASISANGPTASVSAVTSMSSAASASATPTEPNFTLPSIHHAERIVFSQLQCLARDCVTLLQREARDSLVQADPLLLNNEAALHKRVWASLEELLPGHGVEQQTEKYATLYLLHALTASKGGASPGGSAAGGTGLSAAASIGRKEFMQLFPQAHQAMFAVPPQWAKAAAAENNGSSTRGSHGDSDAAAAALRDRKKLIMSCYKLKLEEHPGHQKSRSLSGVPSPRLLIMRSLQPEHRSSESSSPTCTNVSPLIPHSPAPGGAEGDSALICLRKHTKFPSISRFSFQ